MMEKKAVKIKKELFIQSSKTKNIRDDYEYIRELGSGGYGVVFLAQHRVTGTSLGIKGKDELSRLCPRKMLLTRKCSPLKFNFSKNWITRTLSNSTKSTKLKKLFILSLRSVKAVNFSTWLSRKSVWPNLKQPSSWDKYFQLSLIFIITTFAIETWNPKIFYWKKKITLRVSNLSILELPKFSRKSNMKISQKGPLCTWLLRSSVGNTAKKLTIGLVESFCIFFSVDVLLSMEKMSLLFLWASRKVSTLSIANLFIKQVIKPKIFSQSFWWRIQPKDIPL